MKKLILSLLIVLTCFSCDENDEPVTVIADEITITPINIYVNQKGGDGNDHEGYYQRVTITASKTWTAHTNVDWIDIGEKSGVPNDGYDCSTSITVDASYEMANRTAKVVFTCGDLSDTLTVNQSGRSIKIHLNEGESIEKKITGDLFYVGGPNHINELIVTGDSLTEDDFSYLDNFTALTILDISKTATTIIYEGLNGWNSNLVEIKLPSSIVEIKGTAFSNCSSLTTINIPNSVLKIGYSAFHNCTSLTNVNIPKSLKVIEGSAFRNCQSLTEVIVPNNVKKITYAAFKGCDKLKIIKLPDSLKEIDDWTFEDCTSLTSITIPSEVISIGQEAFSGCTSLTTITSHAINPPDLYWNSQFPDSNYLYCFHEVPILKIYVPLESVYRYQNDISSSWGWGIYTDKIEAIPN